MSHQKCDWSLSTKTLIKGGLGPFWRVRLSTLLISLSVPAPPEYLLDGSVHVLVIKNTSHFFSSLFKSCVPDAATCSAECE